MKVVSGFEIIEIANEYIAVPIGEKADDFHGVVALNEATAFLLKQMEREQTLDDLVFILRSEYEVDETRARNDIGDMVENLFNIGLIE